MTLLPALLTSLSLAQGSVATSSNVYSAPAWGVEVRSGPYRPKVSSDEAQRKYFRLIYASGESDSLFRHRPMMTTIFVNRYLAVPFGVAGVRFGVGLWNESGVARRCNGGCTPDNVDSSTAGTTPISFRIMPLTGALTYSFQLPWRRYRIPLIPYAAAGVDYYLWSARTNGEVAVKTNDAGKKVKGEGGTVGLHGTLGLSLNLDWFEAGRQDRVSLHGSYLFIEATPLWANSFGSANRFDASATLVAMGLRVDFR